MFVTNERIEMLNEIEQTTDELRNANLRCLSVQDEQKMTRKIERLIDYLLSDANDVVADTKSNCNHVLVEMGVENVYSINKLSDKKGMEFFIDRLYFCPNCLRRFVRIDSKSRQIIDLIEFSNALHSRHSSKITPLNEAYSIMPVDKPVSNKDQSYLSLLYLRAVKEGTNSDKLADEMRKYYDEDNKKKKELNKRMIMEQKKINLGI